MRSNRPMVEASSFRWAEPLTDLRRDTPVDDPWINEVAQALTTAGIPVRCGYGVGRHSIDLVAGAGAHALAIECSPHRGGIEDHLDRALMLRGAGWKTADAFHSRWEGRAVEFASYLSSQFPNLVS